MTPNTPAHGREANQGTSGTATAGQALPVWSYSGYRALLRRNGVNFAIVTPDGRNAVDLEDSQRLVDLLNAGERAPALFSALILCEKALTPSRNSQDLIAADEASAAIALTQVQPAGLPEGKKEGSRE